MNVSLYFHYEPWRRESLQPSSTAASTLTFVSLPIIRVSWSAARVNNPSDWLHSVLLPYSWEGAKYTFITNCSWLANHKCEQKVMWTVSLLKEVHRMGKIIIVIYLFLFIYNFFYKTAQRGNKMLKWLHVYVLAF